MSIGMNNIMQKFELEEVCCWIRRGCFYVMSWFVSLSCCSWMRNWDFPFVQIFGRSEKRKLYGE